MYLQLLYSSPAGLLTLVSDGSHLVGALNHRARNYHAFRLEGPAAPEDPVLQAAANWLDRYFAGDRPAIAELPLLPAGTAFQQEVWALLYEIPYGSVTTYGAIAEVLAARRAIPRMSARAVGGAVGRNPISIIIPCHRVIGAGGTLGGYGSGPETKRWLLRHEGLSF